MSTPPFSVLRLFALLLLLLACVRPVFAAEDFLDPKLAFVPTARALDANNVAIDFAIAKGYYLYRNRFKFAAGSNVNTGEAVFPKGQEKEDENFGRVEVYFDQVSIRLPVERASSGPLTLALDITSQGCADGGLCYPPQRQQVRIELPSQALTAAQPAATVPQQPSPPRNAGESHRIYQALQQNGFWANIALFFLAGLGLSLTPCVFPMVPILSGIIAGQGQRASHARALALSVIYVLGMAITYTIAGVIAGLSGTLVSGLMQNAWVLSAFAGIFVLLALSMFGFFQLQLPGALQGKLSEEAGHFANGRGFGIFIMGALSALIVGPCVAAPLAGALLYIGKTGNALLGGGALFALAIGMGLPLIAVGLSAGTLLPRVGPWMQTVNRAFGVVLLGMALWLVSPLLPDGLVMVGWATLLIIPAIFLHALDPLPVSARPAQRFMKGVAVILLLVGAAMLAGALAGNRDPLQPLSGFRGKGASSPVSLPFEAITSLAELKTRLQQDKRLAILVVTADWCSDCKRMERDVYTDPAVRAGLAGFSLLKADITVQGTAEQEMMKHFSIFGPPVLMIFNREGQEIARLTGYQNAATVRRQIDEIRRTERPASSAGP